MKSRYFNKKLVLNKKTIADLNGKEMKKAIGGLTGVGTTCRETRIVTCGVNSCGGGSYCLSLPDFVCMCCDPNL